MITERFIPCFKKIETIDKETPSTHQKANSACSPFPRGFPCKHLQNGCVLIVVSASNISRLSSLTILCYMPLSIDTNLSMMVYI